MASIVPSDKDVSEKQDGSIRQIIWTPLTEADVCIPVHYPKHSDKSIQVLGTFGGGTIALHGSNDGGTTYAPLNTPASVAIGIAAAGIKAVLENTEFIKPVATGGTGQSVTIAMLLHFSNPARQ